MLTFTEDEMPPGIGISVIFEGETMSDVNSQDLSQEILASPAKVIDLPHCDRTQVGQPRSSIC